MKSTNLRSYFTFHKAGQGAFYGGRIIDHNKDAMWTIVYDCGTSGSSKKLNLEIDRFQAMNFGFKGKKVIDILFISHLDYDHVSGINRLIKEFLVKRIVIPYFPKEIRQFSLLSVVNYLENIGDNDMSLEDYEAFIENPYDFITRRSEVSEVFIIEPDNDPEINKEYQNYDNDLGDNNEIYPKGTLSNTINNTDIPDRNMVKFYKNNLQFFIKAQWEFTTYLKDIKSTDFKDLKLCLNVVLGNYSNNNLDYDDIKKIVTKHRANAKTCYNKYLGDINAFGLVLVHGPINFRALEIDINMDDELNMSNGYTSYKINFGQMYQSSFLATLLMGDTSINPNNKPVQFPIAFLDKLKFVHIVQVPHHGSIKNWDIQEYSKLKLGAHYFETVINTCNFGFGNTYGHPNPQILSDLKDSIFLNSQFSSVTIRYLINC